jgi:pyruvate carboxylase subunit B
VTPYSQYVKNVALVNAIQVIKGKERWSMIDENTWDMILGKAGQLPGEVADEIKELAKAQEREFFTGDPQILYPDCLDEYRMKMEEKGWDTGEDDEELFEYAMHPQQYEAFKSGEARRKFLEDLKSKKESTGKSPSLAASTPPSSAGETSMPHSKELQLEINGEIFHVSIKYPSNGSIINGSLPTTTVPIESPKEHKSNGRSHSITSPLEGKFYLTKDPAEKGIQIGDKVNKGDVVGYIESMKVLNAVTATQDGIVTEIAVRQGEDVEEDMVIVKLN